MSDYIIEYKRVNAISSRVVDPYDGEFLADNADGTATSSWVEVASAATLAAMLSGNGELGAIVHNQGTDWIGLRNNGTDAARYHAVGPGQSRIIPVNSGAALDVKIVP